MVSEGTPALTAVLAELARALDRLLRRQGLDDIAEAVAHLQIQAIGGDGGLIYFVPPQSIASPPPNRHAATDRAKWSYMYHPGRKRHWLGRVPRRRWTLLPRKSTAALRSLPWATQVEHSERSSLR